MCGIIGYVGEDPALPFLLQGLKRLEYRGYDSSGVALLERGEIFTFRKKGKIAELEKDLSKGEFTANCGIGHTRWATHGIPSERNAHPHIDCQENIALVHNGIIENYRQLREDLEKKGHRFSSETDSEVVVHLLEGEGNPLQRILGVVKKIQGSYALAILFKEEPRVIYGVRKSSPLILGIGNRSTFLASDIPAFLEHTRRAVFLEDEEIVRAAPEEWEVFSFAGAKKEKEIFSIPWDPVSAEKGGFKHFMLKEIYEQPQVLEDTLAGRINLLKGVVVLEEIENLPLSFSRVVIVACGTAYHAGLLGKIYLEKFARLPVEVDYASEFRYCDPLVNETTLVIGISQSGETADTLAAIDLACHKGARVLSICNVMGSSLTRLSQNVIYTRAGVEIGVASTKAFLCQEAVLLLLALYLGEKRGLISKKELSPLLQEATAIPRHIRSILENSDFIHQLAREFYLFRDFLYLGRGFFYPLALEGALKLKEISYLRAEGLSAGEMKHGPIALVDPEVVSVVLVGKGITRLKIIGNIEEIRARQGKIIALVSGKDKEVEDKVDRVISIPDGEETLSPLLAIVPLQLFAYYVALERGCDIDQPRNLAKSVTVE
ncbi:MAG TPA: glutamine--fructose-6-phosphate transaminase (isomerizing) [Candidatus Atribacteria bacterium]|nr:glutamine--fructose-6-phosphate transaminase (isomerizing) [Candidatus Atribacteria bacterium]